MNNNFKKLLASAMALAMVTSVMPATNVDAASYTCSVNDYKAVDMAKVLLDAIKADLKEENVSIDTVKMNQEITWDKVQGSANALKNIWSGKGGKVTVKELLSTGEEVDINGAKYTISDLLKVLAECDGNATAQKLVGKVADDQDGFVFATEYLSENVPTKYTQYVENGKSIKTYTEYKAEKEIYDLFVTFDGYKNNVNIGFAETYTETVTAMKDALSEYNADFTDVSDDYAKEFAKLPVVEGVKVKDLIDGKDFARTDLSKLEKLIKDVKEDKSDLAGIAAYEDVEAEDSVAEIMEELESIVEEIKEVNSLFKSAEFKNLRKVKSVNINTLAAAAEAYDEQSETTVENFENQLAKVRTEDAEIITTYVEDFFNNFYTVKVTKRSNGRYTLRLEDAEYARYVRNESVFGESDSIVKLLTINVDPYSEESVYDLLSVDASDVEQLLKAVEAIENVRVGNTFTDKEADIIIAAKKALVELDVVGTDAANPYGLSSKERRMVKGNADLIDALYAKLIISGDIVKDGWVDLGNGNWDYYKDGKAFTGWVCSAKDTWYYVSNGHMLRDAWVWRDNASAYYVGNDGKMVYGPTTVNGYELDANGLWHK